MSLDRPSRTAIITCLMRTLHTKYDVPALIDDAWADRLVRPEEREEVAAAVMGALPAGDRERVVASAGADGVLHAVWRQMAVYAGVVIRTRYTEERVAESAAVGVRQYVVIGAGLDSFGMRRPGLARDMDVFEVDHPESQALKRARLEACGEPIPETLHFVPADLSSEDLGTALARCGYRSDQPAIMSWLGVTVYLTRDANMKTLRSVARCAAPGSEIIFTYIEERALHSHAPAMRVARAVAASLGEPWLTGFDPGALLGDLAAVGLELVEDLGAREQNGRYCAGRGDGLSPGRSGHVARARVRAG